MVVVWVGGWVGGGGGGGEGQELQFTNPKYYILETKSGHLLTF